MKILFVVSSFNAGGAEKALVSYFNTIDLARYDIYVYTANNSGLFKPLVPNSIQFIEPSVEYLALSHTPYDVRFYVKHPILWMKKILRTSLAKHDKKLHLVQSIWKYWRKDVPDLDMEFDIAVGHLQGIPNYFVIDKVHAKRKILWIHTQYEGLNYNNQYDYTYFQKATAIVTISDLCKRSLINAIPYLEEKYEVLPNIVNTSLIKEMSKFAIEDDYFHTNSCKIVSVGRLSQEKGFDLAIEAAHILKENQFDFIWIVIGEGGERSSLEKKIREYELDGSFFLIGLRANPYSYISRGDVMVQPSRREGKSIFADECKILGKVLVSTNYNTVYDQIKNEENGLIVGMEPLEIAQGVLKAYTNQKLRNKIIANLKNEKLDNVNEIGNYYKLYEGR